MPSGRPTIHYVLDEKSIQRDCAQDSLRVGRADEMDVILPGTIPGISRHHATIRREGARWVIEDNKAKNGTFVDRNRVLAPTILTDGCTIHLGTFPIRFCLPEVKSETSEPSTPISSRRLEVRFSDATSAVQPDMSISMKDFSVTSASSDSGVIVRTMQMDDTETASTRAKWFGQQQKWSTDLFNNLGKALQVSSSVDEMMENVLNHLFMHVTAADSAVILLYDPQTGKLRPVVERSNNPETTQLRVSTTVVQKAIDTGSAMLVRDTSNDPNFGSTESIKGASIVSIVCAPLWQEEKNSGVIYIDSRKTQQHFETRELEIVTGFARFTAIALDLFQQRERVREQERTRERLSRYIGPEIVERISADDGSQMLADRGYVTVLFSDLKGFTTMSERLQDPQKVVDLLNSIFTRLTDAVFRHRGTLDKFIGDGMMAFFGAPLKIENHAREAVLAAKEMLAAIADFNRDLPPEEHIGIRIGINTGDVVVGDIGSPQRKDYTVIGDVVNIASRLESGVAQTNQIVVGPETYSQLGEGFRCEPLPPILLKGKGVEVKPYRVL